MVSEVDEHLGLRPEPATHQRRRAPVGQIGAVEAGLEELVLDEQRQPGRQHPVQLLEAVGEPPVARAQAVLPGIVRAVGEPQADERRAGLLRDLDALPAVLEREPAHVGSGWQMLPST